MRTYVTSLHFTLQCRTILVSAVSRARAQAHTSRAVRLISRERVGDTRGCPLPTAVAPHVTSKGRGLLPNTLASPGSAVASASLFTGKGGSSQGDPWGRSSQASPLVQESSGPRWLPGPYRESRGPGRPIRPAVAGFERVVSGCSAPRRPTSVSCSASYRPPFSKAAVRSRIPA